MPKIALISGCTGQDGSYLAELLLEKGYEVHGIVRRSSTTAGLWRIQHILDRITVWNGDILDSGSIHDIVRSSQPDEVYHLACQSHVAVSFEKPAYTVESILTGTTNMLEAVRHSGCSIRFYQSSSSEMFGDSPPPHNEDTSFQPRSPYACAKLAAYWMVKIYREAYGMHASNGILFNHESPRRGEGFATRKITRAAARIKLGLQEKLHLGDVSNYRDFGFAGDYVQAMWLMLQQDEPDDYVVATGQSYTIERFLVDAFARLGLDHREQAVIGDDRYKRPADVQHLRGDAAKALRVLGWKPTVDFEELVNMMVDGDLKLAKKEVS